MNKLLGQAEQFIKRNSSTILTCIGGIGVVATSVLTAKATPKVSLLLKQAEEDKGDKLTKMETVRVAAPVYIPAILVGASTIACIFGANALNKRQQASMISAYALLENSYKEYKRKGKDVYGEEAEKDVRVEIAKDKFEDSDTPRDENKQLFYDEFSGRYFESTMENVLRAEYKLNRLLAVEFVVPLNEFYDLLGIERTDYGDCLGWSSYELVECRWYSWVDFEHTPVTLDDGLECTIITMSFEPTCDFENY